MAIQPVPSMTPVPNFPALSERAAGTYNASAYAFGNHMSVAFNGELLAVANNVKNNADEAQAKATAAGDAASTAGTAAINAADAASAAVAARNEALTYAQAAGASAGVPTPVANRVLATNGAAEAGWADLATLPTLQAKADKDGAVVTRLSTNRVAYAPTAGATQSIDVAIAGEFQLTPAGALTIAFTNIPAGDVSFVLTLDCINFGGKTITWPAGNWVKADGSFAAAVGNSGVSWQTSGTDFVLVWFKNGTVYYKVMR